MTRDPAEGPDVGLLLRDIFHGKSPHNTRSAPAAPQPRAASQRAERAPPAQSPRLKFHPATRPPVGGRGGFSSSSSHRKGGNMPSFKINWGHVVAIVLALCGLFAIVHDVPPGQERVQTADMQKQTALAQADAQVRIAEEERKREQIKLQIAQVTGAVPSGFISPTVSARSSASIYDAPVDKRTVQVERGQRYGLSPGLSYSFQESADEPSAHLVIQYEVKKIDGNGEYRLVCGGNDSGWQKAEGQISPQMKTYLENNSWKRGNERPVELYTKGKVTFHL